MSQPFTIFQVAWLTKTPGNEGRRSEIIRHIYQIVKFLQDRDLLVRPLVQGIDGVTDDFALLSSDLTDDGLAVIKSTYDKWLTKVDNGMSPEDWSLLDRALKKVRGT